MWFMEAAVLIETQNISKSVICFQNCKKEYVFEVPLCNAKPFLSQSASTDSAAFTNKSTYLWWSSLYNKKMEKFVKTFEIFVAHPWTIERKYKYRYGTKMTIKIDQKIFGQKKLGTHL